MSKTTPCSIQWITGFLLAAAMLPPGAAQENNPGISLGELQHEAATIEQRLQRQEDINAIENLQRSYGYFYDKALWREAADLFSADGSIEIADHGNFIGRERVLAYLRSLGQEGPQYGRLLDHLLLQPIITVAGDGRTARGRWHLLSQGGALDPASDPSLVTAAGAEPGKPFGYVGTGIYENEYVKEDGVWKIQTLRLYPRMTTRDSEGWAKSAYPRSLPATGLAPDAAATSEHSPYPGTSVPPVHYPHPTKN